MLNVRIAVKSIVLFTLMVDNASALYTFTNSLLFKAICFSLKSFSSVSIEVYNLSGRLVTKLEPNKNIRFLEVVNSPVFCELNREIVLYKRHKTQRPFYWLPPVNDTEKENKTPFDSRFDTFLNKMYH